MINKDAFTKIFIKYFDKHKQEFAIALSGNQYILEQLSNNIYNILEKIDNEITENTEIITIQSNYKEFIDNLSNMERSACYAVINKLDNKNCGDVSISILIKETNISRPVFKNLFLKMEKYGIAKLQNGGVSGTHINIIENQILKDFKI